MTDRYIAFDVETPNRRNDRMSSIGIAVVEDGADAAAFVKTYDMTRRAAKRDEKREW